MQPKNVALAATITVGALTLIFAILPPRTTPQQGIISGRVSIGPLCPVEPCPNPQLDIYSSREIVLQPKVGNPIHININTDGRFQAKVNADTYTVSLTKCGFVGCESALPKTVTVEPDKVTVLDISIDTGIR